MEDVNKRRRISFSLSECGPQEINSREIRLHLPFSANWNKRDSVSKTGFLFKSDVFTAVALVDEIVSVPKYSRKQQNWTIIFGIQLMRTYTF